MKRANLFCVMLACCVMVSGCTGYQSKKIDTFYLIHSTVDQAESFFDEIQQYANTFHESLALNVVKIVYASDYRIEVDCTFTAEISKTKNTGRNLSILYDQSQGGIVESEYTVGTKKVASVYEEIICPSSWNITVSEGTQFIKEQMSIRGVSEFDRIVCWCYNHSWVYDIWLAPNSEQPLVITLPMNGTVLSE